MPAECCRKVQAGASGPVRGKRSDGAVAVRLEELTVCAGEWSVPPMIQPGALFPRTEEVKDIVYSSDCPQQIAIFIVAAHVLDRLNAPSNRRQSEIKLSLLPICSHP
jgi:hypothetical protein